MDVADRANVHPATVSHVLAGRQSARISEATRARVLEAAQELGYQPNMAARALAKGRTNVVAVQTPEFANPFFAEIMHRLMEISLESGYSTVASVSHQEFGGLAAHVDGVIALDYSPLNPSQSRLHGMIILGVFAADECDVVEIDFRPAVRQAVARWAQKGLRRIAYLTGEDPLHDIDPRQSEFLAAAADFGLSPEIITVRWNDIDSGRDGLAARLAQANPPQAVLARNDLLAFGAWTAGREAGLRTPEDLAVLGCDGTRQMSLVAPGLGTLRVPIQAACQAAWDIFLLRRLDRETPIQRRTYAADLLPLQTG